MKKYDVFRLYIVKVSTDSNVFYQICRKSTFGDGYIDALTDTKVEVKDESCVSSLASYNSGFGISNYSNEKPLILSKEEILNKVIQINMKYAIMKYEEGMNQKIDSNSKMGNLEEKLEEATKQMFSGKGSWTSDEFSRPKYSLIGHLRDDMWLAFRLQDFGLQDVFFGTLLNYVKTSTLFKTERATYEQRVVKWQIGWMMSGGDGWLVSEEYGGDFIGFDSNCDIGFRRGILKTLEAIGMNTEAIEQGIEENAELWRLQEMRAAFRNTYNPILGFSGEKLKEMKPICAEHKEAWMKLRLYEYYQAHKASVDQYGTVTPEMQISEEEVQHLRTYLSQMHKERITYLEELKRIPSETPKVLIYTMPEKPE